MKFLEALKQLSDDKQARISSEKANAYAQSMSTIKFWLFDNDKFVAQNWENFMAADDWVISTKKVKK